MTGPMKLYISGPMTGYAEFNFPAFHDAAAKLRAAGFDVTSPAENFNGRTDLRLEDYFAEDMAQVCNTDAVVVLPGWEQSKGACLEVGLARHLGHPVYDLNLAPVDEVETPLQEAQRLVHGPRQGDYGHPIDDFTRTGRIWAAILGIDEVTPEQVAMCMVGLKLSRECNRSKRDNRVDAAGYVETLELVLQERERRAGEDEAA